MIRTPKQEAKKLIERFIAESVKVAIFQKNGGYKEFNKSISLNSAKKLALICADETIMRIRKLKISGFTLVKENKYYWEVKKEIENYEF